MKKLQTISVTVLVLVVMGFVDVYLAQVLANLSVRRELVAMESKKQRHIEAKRKELAEAVERVRVKLQEMQ